MGLLDGKRTIVTGAGAGLGRVVALHLAAEGARVLVSDANATAGEETLRLIIADGGRGGFIRCDVSQPRQVRALVAGTVEAWGGLECAVNAAGIVGHAAPLADQTPEDFDEVLAATLRSMFLCLRAELGAMFTAGGGAIVNLCSVAGLTGVAGLSPYVASQHAIVGLTRNAALEYSKSGIRVNAICGEDLDPAQSGGAPDFDPGTIGFVPPDTLDRIRRQVDVAALIAWLLSDRAGLVSGAAISIDPGADPS